PFLGSLYIGGTVDLALDSTGRPHVVYMPQDPAPSTYRQDLWYAYWDGTAWVRTQIDAGTGDFDRPRIDVDASDRPHIVYGAYLPSRVDASPSDFSIRHAFFDGGSWQTEDIDVGREYVGGADPYAEVQIDLGLTDDARALYYVDLGTPSAPDPTPIYAVRSAGPSGVWTRTTLTGLTGHYNSQLERDAAGVPVLVSDGLNIHRPAPWSTTPAIRGQDPAIVRVGDRLFVAYGVPTGTLSRTELYFTVLGL
ncbi:MAG: hypothetical protein KDA28_14210, partial [Phycisphaerales bacterium]|nr:hypothetical protein [Phycisphaerales bacterium]